jgi:hypothetical protein
MPYVKEKVWLDYSLWNKKPENKKPRIVHDGCILCGRDKGKSFRFLNNNLYVHGGFKRICWECREKMKEEKIDIAVSFHEAGHAVAMLKYGIKFYYVSIIPKYVCKDLPYKYFGPVILGHVKHKPFEKVYSNLPKESFFNIRKYTIIDFAGDIAVSILYGSYYKYSQHFKNLDEEWQTDYHSFKEAVLKNPKLEPCRNRFIEDCRSLLLEEWPAVVRIATTLLSEKKISYEKCFDLFNDR